MHLTYEQPASLCYHKALDSAEIGNWAVAVYAGELPGGTAVLA